MKNGIGLQLGCAMSVEGLLNGSWNALGGSWNRTKTPLDRSSRTLGRLWSEFSLILKPEREGPTAENTISSKTNVFYTGFL